jgi:hypothetical protein
LPTHIVDFGTDTGQAVDPGAAAREAAAKAAKVAQELREQIKKEEDAFAKAAYDDGRKAVNYFTARLREFEHTYKELSGSSEDAAHEDLRNRFEREKRQFDAGLPVYAAKEEVRRGTLPANRLPAHCLSMAAHCADCQLTVL